MYIAIHMGATNLMLQPKMIRDRYEFIGDENFCAEYAGEIFQPLFDAIGGFGFQNLEAERFATQRRCRYRYQRIFAFAFHMREVGTQHFDFACEFFHARVPQLLDARTSGLHIVEGSAFRDRVFQTAQ